MMVNFFFCVFYHKKIHKTPKTKCCPSSGPRKEMTGLSFLWVFLLLIWELWSPQSVTPSLAYALNLWCGDVSGDQEHRAPDILLGVGLHGQDPSSLHLWDGPALWEGRQRQWLRQPGGFLKLIHFEMWGEASYYYLCVVEGKGGNVWVFAVAPLVRVSVRGYRDPTVSPFVTKLPGLQPHSL